MMLYEMGKLKEKLILVVKYNEYGSEHVSFIYSIHILPIS